MTAEEIYNETGCNTKRDIIEAMKIYASEKVKEALRLAAHNAGVVFIDGVTKEETIHGQIMSGADIIRPYRDGILSLETEILNQINKEG